MSPEGGRIGRVVALGASNLTRGFQTVVATARTAWGTDVDVLAALGHGRSYGADSAFLVRRLPGILDSGLWRRPETAPSLSRLAQERGARFLELRPSWYGVDPIHIRPSLWRLAWQEILGVTCPTPRSRLEAMRLYAMRPERQWLCGVEQRTDQRGRQLTRGGRVWLY